VLVLVVLALVVVLGMGRCGGGGTERSTRPGPKTVEAADAELRAAADAAATNLAGGAPLRQKPENPPGRQCTDSIGRFTGQYNMGYTVVFDVPPGSGVEAFLQRARAYWEGKGYRVNGGNASDDEPSVLATDGRMALSLGVIVKRNLAELGGSTPCLPSERNDS